MTATKRRRPPSRDRMRRLRRRRFGGKRVARVEYGDQDLWVLRRRGLLEPGVDDRASVGEAIGRLLMLHRRYGDLV
jgi:hypothetical protein